MHPLLDLRDVDPELLRSRLARLDDAVRDDGAAIVEAALRCAARLQDVDLQTTEGELAHGSPAALWSSVTDSMAALWLSLEQLQASMGPLVDAYAAEARDVELARGGAQGGGQVTATEPRAEQAGEPRAGPLVGPGRRIAETAWTIAFVLTGEVQGFQRRLQPLLELKDGWELLGAMQDHLGHVRAAMAALLAGVHAALPGADGLAARDAESLELLASRELRSRVFELRDAVLAVERQLRATPPHSWRELLAQVHRLVESFTFGPGFAWMRATDKRAFLLERRTLGEILEMYSPLRAEPARLTIENLARYLEALEVINQRECLLRADRAALTVVVEEMRLATEPAGEAQKRAAIGAALAALSEAQGRDAELDRLLAQTLEPGSPVPVQTILSRAEAVLASLGG